MDKREIEQFLARLDAAGWIIIRKTASTPEDFSPPQSTLTLYQTCYAAVVAHSPKFAADVLS